jgi:hypothetical protein
VAYWNWKKGFSTMLCLVVVLRLQMFLSLFAPEDASLIGTGCPKSNSRCGGTGKKDPANGALVGGMFLDLAVVLLSLEHWDVHVRIM